MTEIYLQVICAQYHDMSAHLKHRAFGVLAELRVVFLLACADRGGGQDPVLCRQSVI